MQEQNIKHHLSDALLMGYASGNLPEAFNLVVASHISMCDTCRAALAEFEAVGGEVMMATDQVPMSADALEATLAKLCETPEPAPTPALTKGIFPSPLRQYVNGDLDQVVWRKVGGGVSQMVLPTSSDATVRLLHIPAGVEVPDHGHRGTELTLVLQGAFRDESDRFGAGDIEVANEDMQHTPVAEEGMDCICLAATDAPLRFKGILPRVMQPFMGI